MKYARHLQHLQSYLHLVVMFVLVGLACARAPETPRPSPPPVPAPTVTTTPPGPPGLADAAAPTDAEASSDSGVPIDALAEAAAITVPRLTSRGVNLSGAEFGACCPGRLGLDYGYPTNADVDLFVARGFTHLRVPFRHERLQRALRADLDPGEWTRLEALIAYAAGRRLTVAIEPHNFARYNGAVLNEIAMGDLWGRIATRIAAKPYAHLVMFNLTNEPHDLTTERWLALAQAGVREIRRVGSKAVIIVPGNAWTSAANWSSTYYGTPNSAIMQQVTDPGSVFEVHLYLDQDSSGKYASGDCVNETVGVDRLRNFVTWLKQHKRVGYLGEIGAPNTPRCRVAVTNTLRSVEAEPALWTGWAWWSAGARWRPDYQLSLQPILVDAGGAPVFADRPQMEWLRPFLSCGGL